MVYPVVKRDVTLDKLQLHDGASGSGDGESRTAACGSELHVIAVNGALQSDCFRETTYRELQRRSLTLEGENVFLALLHAAFQRLGETAVVQDCGCSGSRIGT